MLTPNWRKCGNDSHWCDLAILTLDTITDKLGVYIIWHAGNPSRVVKIGQGKIANRLSRHRNDTAITAYSRHGRLLVTWASIPAAQLDGVERYLAEKFQPLVGDAYPDVDPIPVKSPFAA